MRSAMSMVAGGAMLLVAACSPAVAQVATAGALTPAEASDYFWPAQKRFPGPVAVEESVSSAAPVAGIAPSEVGVWKTLGMTAAGGAALVGAAGYMLYPHLAPDYWLSRGQHTALTAAQGALLGAAVGGVYVLMRRFWSSD